MQMTKEEMVKRIKEGCEAEKYFPGVLGNPVTFAARWGLPLSKGYLASKERELRIANRVRRRSAIRHNGATKARRQTADKQLSPS